ncbi:hypothetical protein MYXO_00054 [Myxococcaceae bacterium]|nr:hypothetical protein MYXO_00054 [Myxococcaceae bacterium]
MRRIFFAFSIALAAAPVRAEVLDVAAATCSDLGHHAARRFYAFWFDGYLAAKQGRTVSDGEKMEQRMERVAKACEANPAQKLLPLIEKEK